MRGLTQAGYYGAVVALALLIWLIVLGVSGNYGLSLVAFFTTIGGGVAGRARAPELRRIGTSAALGFLAVLMWAGGAPFVALLFAAGAISYLAQVTRTWSRAGSSDAAPRQPDFIVGSLKTALRDWSKKWRRRFAIAGVVLVGYGVLVILASGSGFTDMTADTRDWGVAAGTWSVVVGALLAMPAVSSRVRR